MIKLSPDFDWNQARAFLTTAEEGSLSAAARKLGQTQPTLSRQVAGLEKDLGVLLFERVGRGLALTQSGGELLEHFEKMGRAAENISLTASGQSQTVEGCVSIAATDIMATYFLPDAIKDLRDIAPGIEIELVVANEISDLQRREADIAIRHIRPEQPELIGKLLGQAEGCVYGSVDYFARFGMPQNMGDFNAARFVSYGSPEEFIGYMNALGASLSAQNIKYDAGHGVAGWEMVKKGLGLGAMINTLAERAPDIRPVLPKHTTMRFPIWLTAHKELHTGKRFRIVFDFLAEYLPRTLPVFK